MLVQTDECSPIPWRVLIVEDDPAMCAFFAASVEKSPRLQLAGMASTVAQARKWLESDSGTLDVLLTDLGLPDGSGLDVIRLAKRWRPACEALVISMFGDEENVIASIEAGALGYIHKDATPEDIAEIIEAMKRGASPISPMVARGLLSRFQTSAREKAAQLAADRAPNPLSQREREVLDLIARGFSYSEISRLKSISVHTVQSHIKNLYGKLEVHSRSEAVYEAIKMGLLSTDYLK